MEALWRLIGVGEGEDDIQVREARALEVMQAVAEQGWDAYASCWQKRADEAERILERA